MSYPGGKGNTFRQIINLMPPHDTYVEPFLGGGAVFLHKRLAAQSILNDIDNKVLDQFRSVLPENIGLNCRFFCCDAVDLIRGLTPTKSMLVYCDPPYLLETRKSGRLYKFEYSRSQHAQLLDALLKLDCMVMVSAYPNGLYSDKLSGWNFHTFSSITRGGSVAQECIWFNFEKPTFLHDYSYVGSTFRDRDVYTRQRKRMVAKLSRLAPKRRHALLLAIIEKFSEEIRFCIKNFH